MSRINSTRSGCKDVFNAFLVKNATYAGELEIPQIAQVDTVPTKLVSFSKSMKSTEHDSWVHFYEDDAAFERLWRNPRKYLSILKRFSGVIAPDFSLYRDMPFVMQLWNIYRSHAVASWLQENNIPVIANIRWGDSRTHEACCTGVPRNAIIAIGSHECVKLKQERVSFTEGLEHVVQKLEPRTIIVYGTAPNSIFEKYRQTGIEILQFDREYMIAHRKAGEY